MARVYSVCSEAEPGGGWEPGGLKAWVPDSPVQPRGAGLGAPCGTGLPGHSLPGSLGAGSTATSGGRRSSPRGGPAHGCRPEATAAPLPFSVPNPRPATPWPSIAPEVNGVTTHPGGTLTLKWDSPSGLEAPPADVAVVGMEPPGRGALGEVRSRHPRASLPDAEAGG